MGMEVTCRVQSQRREEGPKVKLAVTPVSLVLTLFVLPLALGKWTVLSGFLRNRLERRTARS